MLRSLEGAVSAMKALVQEGDGSADVLHLRDVDLPVLTDDRVLVRVRAASVNAADYHTVHGGRLVRIAGKVMRTKPNPINGIDVSGVVEKVGANVSELRPGEEVFGCASSTFAEYATGTTRGLMPKPRELSFAEAGAMGVAGITALQALRDHGGVTAASACPCTARAAAWARSRSRSRRPWARTSPPRPDRRT
jgi:NADPH:quinone reductase-like Zn-dependent oxidoreductase